MKTIPFPTPATAVRPGPLDREITALGFVPGNPPHLSMASVLADVRVYRTQRCSACRHRGMSVRRWHRGRDHRLVLTCRACGRQTEA
jgi:hypothetical protein